MVESVSQDLYTKSTTLINYYNQTTFGTEINLRQEFINTLDGQYPEIAKRQLGIFRKMRRDSNGNLIECDCVDKITREPDKDRFCPICFSESYLFDEIDIEFYKILKDSDTDNALKDTLKEPGLINLPLVVFYTRYDSEITQEDKIVTLELNLDGTRKSPIRRQGIYRINTAWDYRSDNGKLEYWKIFTHKESVRFINAPSYEAV